jgi:hypothetical protein
MSAFDWQDYESYCNLHYVSDLECPRIDVGIPIHVVNQT